MVGLEPTSRAGGGFQDRCVYQFHHTGISCLSKGCRDKGKRYRPRLTLFPLFFYFCHCAACQPLTVAALQSWRSHVINLLSPPQKVNCLRRTGEDSARFCSIKRYKPCSVFSSKPLSSILAIRPRLYDPEIN